MNMSTRDSSSDKTGMIDLLDDENLENILSQIVIPFSEVIQTPLDTDIYKGYEKIPFKMRDPLYKAILLQEFGDVLYNFNKL
jgi:hypothetical protein